MHCHGTYARCTQKGTSPRHDPWTFFIYILAAAVGFSCFWTSVVEARVIGWIVSDGTVIDGLALNRSFGSPVVTVGNATAFISNATGSRSGRGIVVRNGAALNVDIGVMYQRLTNPDGNITVIVESTRFETNASLFVVGQSATSYRPPVPRVEVFVKIFNCTFDNALLAFVNFTDIHIARWTVLVEGNVLTRNTMPGIPTPITTGSILFDSKAALSDVSANMIISTITIPDSRSTFSIQNNTFVSGGWGSNVTHCPEESVHTYGVASVGRIWVKNGGQYVFQNNVINVTSMPINPVCDAQTNAYPFYETVGVRLANRAKYIFLRNRLFGLGVAPSRNSNSFGYSISRFDVLNQSQFLLLNNTINATSVSNGNSSYGTTQSFAVQFAGSSGNCSDQSLVQVSYNNLTAISAAGSSTTTFAIYAVSGNTFVTNSSQHFFTFNTVYSWASTTSDLNSTAGNGGGFMTSDFWLLQQSQASVSFNVMSLGSTCPSGRAVQLQILPLYLTAYTARDGSLLQLNSNSIAGETSGSSYSVQPFFVLHRNPSFDSGSIFLISDNDVALNATSSGITQAFVFHSAASFFSFTNGSQLVMQRNTIVSNTTAAKESRTFGTYLGPAAYPFFVVSGKSALIIQDNTFMYNSHSTSLTAQQFGIWNGGNNLTFADGSMFAIRRNIFLLNARSSATTTHAMIYGYSLNNNLTISYGSSLVFHGNQIWANALNDNAGPAHIYCYRIWHQNFTVSYDSNVIFQNELCNATSVAVGQGYTSGFHHGGNIALLHTSRWLVQNTSVKLYSAGWITASYTYYMIIGTGLLIRNNSQMMFLKNNVLQHVTTPTSGVSNQAFVFHVASKSLVIADNSAWIIGDLNLECLARAAIAGTSLALCTVINWNTNVTVGNTSQFTFENSSLSVDARSGYAAVMFFGYLASYNAINIGNFSQIQFRNLTANFRGENLAALGGTTHSRGFYFDTDSSLNIFNGSVYSMSENTFTHTVVAYPGNGYAQIYGILFSATTATLNLQESSQLIVRKNTVTSATYNGVSQVAYMLYAAGSSTWSLEFKSQVLVQSNTITFTGSSNIFFQTSSTAGTLTMGKNAGAIVFDANAVTGTVTNSWFSSPPTGVYYLRCNLNNGSNWDLGLTGLSVAQSVTTGCTNCASTFDCKIYDGTPTGGAAPCTCTCSGGLGPVDTNCWPSLSGIPQPTTNRTITAPSTPIGVISGSGLVTLVPSEFNLPPMRIVGTVTKTLRRTRSSSFSFPSVTASGSLSQSDTLGDYQKIDVSVKNMVLNTSTAQLMYSVALNTSIFSSDTVRVGTNLSLKYSLLRLPNATATPLTVAISVVPSTAATVLSGSSVLFSSTDAALMQEETLVRVESPALGLGNFSLQFHLMGAAASSYHTPSPILIRVEPQVTVQLFGEVPRVMRVGTNYTVQVSVTKAPIPGMPLTITYTGIAFRLAARPSQVEIRYPSTSAPFQLIPLRRVVALNLSFQLQRDTTGEQYTFAGGNLSTFPIVEVVKNPTLTPTFSESKTQSLTLTPAATPTIELPSPTLEDPEGNFCVSIASLMNPNGPESSRTTRLMLRYDAFNTAVFGSLPGTAADRRFATAGTTPVAQCLTATATSPALLVYYYTMAQMSLANSSTLKIVFQSSRGNATATALYYFRNDEFLTLTLTPSCLTRNSFVKPVTLRFLYMVHPPPTSSAQERAQIAGEVLGALTLAMGAGGLAVQAPRAMAIFGMVSCQPGFNQSLGFLENPFQVSIGPDSYGQFVASMTLNHVLIYGLPLLHLLAGLLRSLVARLSLTDALVWVRFPSLSILPIMYWGNPTVSSAVIIAIYGPEPWHRPVAIVSLVLSFLPLGLMLWHLVRGWGGVMIPGVNPFSHTARRQASDRLETEGYSAKAHSPPWQTWKKMNLLKRRIGDIGNWFYFCLDGGVKWRDQRDRQGYCRANRLLFMDFTEQYYWFGVVDIGLAQLTGIVEGLKLGPAQCTGTLFGLIFMLGAFLIFLLWKRPYNSHFGSVFAVVTTFLQFIGACFLAAWMYGGAASYQDLAEQATLISLYLLIGKAVLDIIPKGRRIVEFLLRLARRRRSTPKNNTKERLSERLLEVVQQDEELRLKDHNNAVTSEVVNALRDAELPEQEDDGDILLGPPPLSARDDGDDLPLPRETSLDFAEEPKQLQRKRSTLADLNPLFVDGGAGDNEEDAESRKRTRQLRAALYGEQFGTEATFGSAANQVPPHHGRFVDAVDSSALDFDIDSILPPPLPDDSSAVSSQPPPPHQTLPVFSDNRTPAT